MITLKSIKKVMKEFGKTAEDALEFLIKIEEANIRLQKEKESITKTTTSQFDNPFEKTESTAVEEKDEDDIYIDQHCNDDSYDKALAEGEARTCPLKDVEYTKQLLKDLPRTNPRAKKYLEAAESWIEKYQEIDHEYNIGTFSVTSDDTESTDNAEEARLNAVYAFITPLVTKAAELARFDGEKETDTEEEKKTGFSTKNIQAFYDSLGEED